MIGSRTLSCCIVILSLSAATAADDHADELKRVMGRWERTFANNAGTQFRVVKDVFEDYDTVTTYDDVGNVVMAHRSEFKIETRSRPCLFILQLRRHGGSGKGEQHFKTNSYIYRVDDESFIEVWGMLDGDPNPPRMLGWKRVKTPK